MDYTGAEYRADLAAMGFEHPKVQLTKRLLEKRRRWLAATVNPDELPSLDPEELSPLDAACARLMAWVESGRPIPGTSTREQQAELAKIEKAIWDEAVKGQLERHIARRGFYPDVLPPRPEVAPARKR